MEATTENFSERFCQRFHIRQERFVGSLLWRSFRPLGVPFIPILKILPLNFFRNDIEFLHAVGKCSSMPELLNVVRTMPAYYCDNWYFRDKSGLRISGRRLLNLASDLFSKNQDR